MRVRRSDINGEPACWTAYADLDGKYVGQTSLASARVAVLLLELELTRRSRALRVQVEQCRAYLDRTRPGRKRAGEVDDVIAREKARSDDTNWVVIHDTGRDALGEYGGRRP